MGGGRNFWEQAGSGRETQERNTWVRGENAGENPVTRKPGVTVRVGVVSSCGQRTTGLFGAEQAPAASADFQAILGSPVEPFYPFLGEGSPTKTRKKGTLIRTSLLQDPGLVGGLEWFGEESLGRPKTCPHRQWGSVAKD